MTESPGLCAGLSSFQRVRPLLPLPVFAGMHRKGGVYRLLIEQIGAGGNQEPEQCPPTVLSGSSWLGVTAFYLWAAGFPPCGLSFPVSLPRSSNKHHSCVDEMCLGGDSQ